MYPPKKEFEKYDVDVWLTGTISEIQYDMKHAFKKTEAPAVKIKIAIDGYKTPKSTAWLLFSYAKKSNMYAWFIEPLVEGATEYMEFDLDQIKDMRIKIMLEQSGEYQNILSIRPLDKKIKPDPVMMDQTKGTDEPPF